MSECFYFWLLNRGKKVIWQLENNLATNKSNDMGRFSQNTRNEYVTKIQILGLMHSDVRISQDNWYTARLYGSLNII